MLQRVDAIGNHLEHHVSNGAFLVHHSDDLAGRIELQGLDFELHDPNASIVNEHALQGHRQEPRAIGVVPGVGELAAQHAGRFPAQHASAYCVGRLRFDQLTLRQRIDVAFLVVSQTEPHQAPWAPSASAAATC